MEQFRADEKVVATSLLEGEASAVMAEGQKNFYDDLHFTPLKVRSPRSRTVKGHFGLAPIRLIILV